MNFNEYQQKAVGFRNKKSNDTFENKLNNAALGLSGESGEFADIIKKIIFHEHPFTKETRVKLAKELGDVLWYIATAAETLEISLEEIAEQNITKLSARYGTEFSAEASINRKI